MRADIGPEPAEDVAARFLQCDQKPGIRQRRQAIGLGSRHRPDDRTSAIGQRQESERSRRQETLQRRLGVRQFAFDMRDQCGLLGIASCDGQAKQGTDARLAAVGGDNQARPHRFPVAEPRLNAC